MAPFPVVVLLVLAWGVIAGQFIAIWRRERTPWAFLAVPGAAALLWVMIVPGLGSLLGWNA